MADEKELMRKDLLLILQIDNKLHYDDISSVQKIHNAVAQKNMFQTNLGKRYVNKLDNIIQGNDTGNCFFCGKEVSNPSETVICKDCSSKYIKKLAAESGASDKKPAAESSISDKKPAAESGASDKQSVTSHNKGTEIKDKVLQNAGNLVDQTKKKVQAADIKTQAQDMRSKKNLIIAVIALIVIIAIIGAIGLNTIFSIVTVVSLGYLIYACLKKKPRKKAVTVFVVCFLLTAITGLFSTGADSNDYANYLGCSEKQITKKFGEPKEVIGNDDWKMYKYMGISFTIDSKDGADSVSFSSGAPSSANTQGLHLGDSAKSVTDLSQKGWDITTKQSESQTIYLLSKTNKGYFIKVYTEGSVITAIDILSDD